jgi:hypothetical protein
MIFVATTIKKIIKLKIRSSLFHGLGPVTMNPFKLIGRIP